MPKKDPPVCRRCQTDFPIVNDAPWQMGVMRLLEKAGKAIARRYATEWDEPDYLCGNCWFDLHD